MKHIKELIKQGEHQQLDFKFEISNAKKIARTLSAFSNTDGGKLLIGVKDNGKISGIQSEEEIYMIKGAADLYCKPPIPIQIDSWEEKGKTVLEITIKKSDNQPIYAKDEAGHWKAWIRRHDENFIANRILIKSWARKKRKQGTYIEITKKEEIFLEYLDKYRKISYSKLKKITNSTRAQTDKMLINFLSLDIIEQVFFANGIFYIPKNQDFEKLLPDRD